MQEIRVKFIQNWLDFPSNDNFIIDILKKKYEVILDDINFDYVFGGYIPGKKSILITFEPHVPKNIQYHYKVLTQYYVPDDNRYVRIPLYIHYIYNFIKEGTIDSMDWFFKERNFNENLLEQKTNFCAFVHTGTIGDTPTGLSYRDKFMLKLSKYKKVDCLGSRGNNTNRAQWAGDNGIQNSIIKRNVIKNYKFCFSFENSTTNQGYMGYTSEKLIDPMVANTLPLYWGNELISQEFNTKSFINWHDYQNDEEMIEKIIEIDNNDDLYLKYMNEKLSLKNENLNMEFLINQMDKILF